MANVRKEPLVYWEKQGADRMCALHCLNSLLQGPCFTEADLSTIGAELDSKERNLMAEAGTQSEQYKAFIAEGSGNAAADGYFNISVLIECLRRKRILCLCQSTVGDHEEQGVDFGYMLNHADHWVALRRVGGTWFNLDSMKPAPTVISDFHMTAFLSSLKGQGYTIFVVRPEVGDLPPPRAMQTLNNSQFYLSRKDITDLQRQAAEKEAKYSQDAQREAAGLESESKSFLAKTPRGQERQHVWPEHSGYRLYDDHVELEPTHNLDDLDDPELKAAIRLSVQTYKEEIIKLPEEPFDSDRVKTLTVRTRTGKRLSRRFEPTNTMKNVFDWLRLEGVIDVEETRASVALSDFSLLQMCPRRRFCSAGNAVLMYGTSEEVIDVSNASLEFLEFRSRDLLTMHLV